MTGSQAGATRWAAAQEVFHRAVELPPAERPSYMDRMLGDDESLKAEVSALLAAHEDAAGFLEGAAVLDQLLVPTLAEGTVVSGRYRIVRFLASGGMGEVYEALDTTLGDVIALKILRSEVALGPESLERFRQEAQKARRVTHPNVCRVHDFGIHAPAGVPPRPFLTMELLKGQTLAERLAAGEIDETEAHSIARDISRGLEAAHLAGVVHGDVKTANILVTSDNSQRRAVVTDFGIAATISPGERVKSPMAGTPDYMAPEQLRGAPPTPASDIYSLGVILHEIATGTRPSGPGSSTALADQGPHSAWFRRLWGARPRRTIARVAERCLRERPADRFRDLGAVLAQLTRARPRVQPAFVATLLLLAAGLLAWWLDRSPGTEVPGETGPRRSIALIDMENRAAATDRDWLGAAFSESLGAELASGETLRLIPGSAVAQAKANLGLDEDAARRPEGLKRLRSLLGADWFVLGSYESDSDRLRLEVQVFDSSGKSVASASDAGLRSDIGQIARNIGAVLRAGLGVAASAGPARSRGALPTAVGPMRSYVDGLSRMRSQRYREAVTLLREVTAVEPNFALAHYHLARALKEIGEDNRARDASRRAVALSNQLSREERLLIEAQDQYLNLDPEGAEQTYATLFRFFPDNIDYGLRILTINPRPKVARRILESLRQLPPPIGNDIRIDLAEAALWFPLEVPGALVAARRAVARATALDAKPLLAEALYREAVLTGAAGDTQRTLDLLGRARALLPDANGPQLVRVHSEMALSLLRLGRTGDALANIEIALPRAIEAGQKAPEIELLYMRAVARKLQGNLADAEVSLNQAAAAATRFRSGNAEAWVKEESGRILRLRGQVARARAICEDTLHLGWDPSSPEPLDMARVLMDQARTSEARPLLEASVKSRRERGQFYDALEAGVELAALNLAEGRISLAVSQAQSVEQELAAGGHRPLQTLALAVWARALIADRKPASAAALLRAARPWLDVGTGYEGVLFTIEEARALARVGQTLPAIEAARSAIDRAQRSGFQGAALRSRLVMAQIEPGLSPSVLRQRALAIAREAARLDLREIEAEGIAIAR